MVPEALERLVAAMADPGFYPHRPDRVEHLQTHISHVFLAGPYVYKLKKPVRFSFLDFGTAARRRHFCEEEVRLNSRLAPGVYLGVVPITAAPDGRFMLHGEGDPVAQVVWMRRLPTERMLVPLLERGEVQPALIERLAGHLAAFHASVASGPEIAAHAEPAALRVRCEENAAAALPFVGELLAAEDHEILADFGPSFIARHETLLRTRQAGGHIRDGHGDLHAEHVCDLDVALPARDGLPAVAPGLYVFDCLEFSPALRACDVASEVAFLAMDLDRLGHHDLAARFVNAYVAASADQDVTLLLPFYASYRAGVRGKVESLKSAEVEVAEDERAAAARRATDYWALAARYCWQAGDPVVIVCCGLSGSGKSALAGKLALATGFGLVSTDALRRRASGTSTPVAYDAGGYAQAARDATYAQLLDEMDRTLAAGRGIIVDATFARRAHRDDLARIVRQHRRRHVFAWCQADEATVHERLDARTLASLSDARWETYVGQRAALQPLAVDEPTIEVDTDGELAHARASAIRALWSWRRGRLAVSGPSSTGDGSRPQPRRPGIVR